MVGDGAVVVEGAPERVAQVGEAGQRVGERRPRRARPGGRSDRRPAARGLASRTGESGSARRRRARCPGARARSRIGRTSGRTSSGGAPAAASAWRAWPVSAIAAWTAARSVRGSASRRPLTSHGGPRFAGQEGSDGSPTRCRAPRFGLPPTFASFAPAPGARECRSQEVLLRLIGHPLAALGLLAGGEGLALAPNARLFVLTLLVTRASASRDAFRTRRCGSNENYIPWTGHPPQQRDRPCAAPARSRRAHSRSCQHALGRLGHGGVDHRRFLGLEADRTWSGTSALCSGRPMPTLTRRMSGCRGPRSPTARRCGRRGCPSCGRAPSRAAGRCRRRRGSGRRGRRRQRAQRARDDGGPHTFMKVSGLTR